ncbi:hypothetical protein [Streptomyces profundus]|uniref:hypothetical protein n=1 Tax=Streptomyces profundus TaxID=2867410 RepID=UPI001D16A9A2|nr:hypothetical protein [Streptomyces sp. MA3_2.13]UED82795.1 hypothetical protein K4G22_00190 [Streptomyces sp. MA3_2.13]
MEYHHLLAALVLGQSQKDNGSGPPPAVSDLEADRRAGRRAAPAPAAGAPLGQGPRGRRRRRTNAAPVPVT